MFTRLLHQTATLIRPGVSGFDHYGNETVSYPGSGDEPVELRCRIQENAGREDDDDRASVQRTSVGYFDAAELIEPHDRFEIAGEVWEVIGQPVLRHDATGPHHYEVNLQRVQV
jgi:hypothetical protein